MVWKSVISDVGIKLIRADNWSLGEIKIANTKVNEWEQLEFDFTDHIGNPYDQIVVFPDFNDRRNDNIIYINNIYGELATVSCTYNSEEIYLDIFPNPARDFIQINSSLSFSSCEIYSLDAQLHHTSSIEQDKVDIAVLGTGMYVLKLQSPSGIVTELFFKC